MHQKPKLSMSRINLGPHAQKGISGYKGNPKPKATEKGAAQGVGTKKPSALTQSKASSPSLRVSSSKSPHVYNARTNAVKHHKPVGGSSSVVTKIAPRATKAVAVSKRPNNPIPQSEYGAYGGRTSTKVGRL